MKRIPPDTVCVRAGSNGKHDQSPPYLVDNHGCVVFL